MTVKHALIHQDVLENEDISLDGMFISSLVKDLLQVTMLAT